MRHRMSINRCRGLFPQKSDTGNRFSFAQDRRKVSFRLITTNGNRLNLVLCRLLIDLLSFGKAIVPKPTSAPKRLRALKQKYGRPAEIHNQALKSVNLHLPRAFVNFFKRRPTILASSQTS